MAQRAVLQNRAARENFSGSDFRIHDLLRSPGLRSIAAQVCGRSSTKLFKTEDSTGPLAPGPFVEQVG